MSLDEILARVFAALAEGVTARDSPFRTPTLATVAPDGSPDVRSVVLRVFDGAARRLTVYSDLRAAKVTQIRENPAVALHVWDARRQVQLRLWGTALVRAGDAAAWAGLPPVSRRSYGSMRAPGSEIIDPAHTDAWDDTAAFAAFAVIDIGFSRLETLHLTGHAQTRARFVWRDGAVSAAWLAP